MRIIWELWVGSSLDAIDHFLVFNNHRPYTDGHRTDEDIVEMGFALHLAHTIFNASRQSPFRRIIPFWIKYAFEVHVDLQIKHPGALSGHRPIAGPSLMLTLFFTSGMTGPC